MSDRDDTVPTRTPRKPISHPKLEALGWDRDDPTEIMRNSLAKLEGASEGGRRKLAEQVSDARSSAKAAIRKCDQRGRR